MTEHPGAAGSIVVLFQDRVSQQGFDIFIVPYAEPKITQARFLMDEPSGVINNEPAAASPGVSATSMPTEATTQ